MTVLFENAMSRLRRLAVEDVSDGFFARRLAKDEFGGEEIRVVFFGPTNQCRLLRWRDLHLRWREWQLVYLVEPTEDNGCTAATSG